MLNVKEATKHIIEKDEYKKIHFYNNSDKLINSRFDRVCLL